MAKRKYNGEVVNTSVTQDELAALQTELFAAAREALAAARAEGNIPSSLLTSCHNLIKDAGMRPDTEGVGDGDDEAAEAAARGYSPNWIAAAKEAVAELDGDF